MTTSYPFITELYSHEIVSLEIARKWLRMDIEGYEGEDDLITETIDSAVSLIEEVCNLSLGISDYQWNTTCLPCHFEDVFFVKEITSVKYHDGSSYVDINISNYELLQVSKRRSVIVWSDSLNISSSRFQITFKAGFEEGKVPALLLQAIRAKIGEEFDNRGDGVSEKKTLSDKLMDKIRIGYAG